MSNNEIFKHQAKIVRTDVLKTNEPKRLFLKKVGNVNLLKTNEPKKLFFSKLEVKAFQIGLEGDGSIGTSVVTTVLSPITSSAVSTSVSFEGRCSKISFSTAFMSSVEKSRSR